MFSYFLFKMDDSTEGTIIVKLIVVILTMVISPLLVSSPIIVASVDYQGGDLWTRL